MSADVPHGVPRQSQAELVFCESAADVALAVSRLEIVKAGHILVALTPEAIRACQRQGLSYTKVESAIWEADLGKCADTVFRDVRDWANWTDRYLADSIPAFGAGGFRPTEASFCILLQFLGGIFEANYTLTRFLESTKPRKIWYRKPRHETLRYHLRYETPHHASLLVDVASRYGIALEELPGERTSAPSGSDEAERVERRWGVEPGNGQAGFRTILQILRRTRSVIRQRAIVRELLLLRTASAKAVVRSWIARAGTREDVLIVGCGYDLDPLTVPLRMRGARVTRVDDVNLRDEGGHPGGDRSNEDAEGLRNRLVESWKNVVGRSEFWSHLGRWGVARNSRIDAALSLWWHTVIPQLWRGYQQASKTLAARKFEVVVALEAGATLCGPYLQRAGSLGIPRVIYQHGSASRMRIGDVYPYLTHSDLFLVYGDGTAGHLRSQWPLDRASRASIVPVGSSRLDALRSRMTKARIKALRARVQGGDPRPVVLYIPTIMGVWERTLSDTTGYIDTSYFELQARVVKVFARYPHVRLLYKDMPRITLQNPIPGLIKAEVPNGTAVYAPPLSELVWAVDGIVIDHAITAMGEALLTAKRMVAFNPPFPGQGLEPADANDLLRKRARVAETADGFVEAVEQFLSVGDFSDLEAPNDEYLKAFGTHWNDGESSRRAVDEIARLLGAAVTRGTERES